MKRSKTFKITIMVLLVLGLIAQVGNAIKLGDVIKVGGIIYIVDKYSKNINTFINSIMSNKGVEIKQTTKVVPILSIG